ncbi:hypothetical protein FKP32DRAFT_1685015 [Trametes sanguinea]|nr:hypothetical protein FKP32DRAFT_1685015 [Trametes sanguinea]
MATAFLRKTNTRPRRRLEEHVLHAPEESLGPYRPASERRALFILEQRCRDVLLSFAGRDMAGVQSGSRGYVDESSALPRTRTEESKSEVGSAEEEIAATVSAGTMSLQEHGWLLTGRTSTHGHHLMRDALPHEGTLTKFGTEIHIAGTRIERRKSDGVPSQPCERAVLLGAFCARALSDRTRREGLQVRKGRGRIHRRPKRPANGHVLQMGIILQARFSGDEPTRSAHAAANPAGHSAPSPLAPFRPSSMTGATNATGIVVVEETDPQITHVCLAAVKVPTLSRIPVREPRIPSGTGAHACDGPLESAARTTVAVHGGSSRWSPAPLCEPARVVGGRYLTICRPCGQCEWEVTAERSIMNICQDKYKADDIFCVLVESRAAAALMRTVQCLRLVHNCGACGLADASFSHEATICRSGGVTLLASTDDAAAHPYAAVEDPRACPGILPDERRRSRRVLRGVIARSMTFAAGCPSPRRRRRFARIRQKFDPAGGRHGAKRVALARATVVGASALDALLIGASCERRRYHRLLDCTDEQEHFCSDPSSSMAARCSAVRTLAHKAREGRAIACNRTSPALKLEMNWLIHSRDFLNARLSGMGASGGSMAAVWHMLEAFVATATGIRPPAYILARLASTLRRRNGKSKRDATSHRSTLHGDFEGADSGSDDAFRSRGGTESAA